MSESITPDVERVLRALDERCMKAIDTLMSMRTAALDDQAYNDHLASKAQGVRLAHSYIADALRGVL